MLKTWEKNLLRQSLDNVKRLVEDNDLTDAIVKTKELTHALEAIKGAPVKVDVALA